MQSIVHFFNGKVMATRDMIDAADYLQVEELLILVQSINIQNQELYKWKDKFMFAS